MSTVLSSTVWTLILSLSIIPGVVCAMKVLFNFSRLPFSAAVLDLLFFWPPKADREIALAPNRDTLASTAWSRGVIWPTCVAKMAPCARKPHDAIQNAQWHNIFRNSRVTGGWLNLVIETENEIEKITSGKWRIQRRDVKTKAYWTASSSANGSWWRKRNRRRMQQRFRTTYTHYHHPHHCAIFRAN